MKILRDDNTCKGAVQVIEWVKGCFDALDRKHLKAVILAIYKDAEHMDNAIESYTFRFGYDSIDVSRKDGESKQEQSLLHATNADEVKKATVRLLRTLIVLSQTLNGLPTEVMMTMKLQYLDTVPEDYDPPGFKPCEQSSVNVAGNPHAINVGGISTEYHSVKLRIKTSCHQYPDAEPVGEEQADNGVPDEQPIRLSDLKLETPPPSAPGSAHAAVIVDEAADEQDPDDREQEMEDERADMSEENVEKGEEVRCPCGDEQDDGLMVKCEICTTWQHGVCFGFLCNDDVPEKHYCDQCCMDGSTERPPSDPILCYLNPITLQATCLWRRGLMACSESSRILVPGFARRLGVEINVAQGIVHRLEREGYITAPTKGKRLGKVVNKEKISTDGIKKYFDRSLLRPLDGPAEEETDASEAAPANIEDDLEEVTTSAANLALDKSASQAATPPRRCSARGKSKQQDENTDMEYESSQEFQASGSAKRQCRRGSIAKRAIRL